MPISKDIETQLAAEGISVVHAESFLEISKAEDCVILTRSPGRACLGLLADGYDAKGFHIKGKSCDWGPMAGFLCAEPLLSKKGGGGTGALDNARAHHSSLTKDFEAGQRSTLIPLELSDDRVRKFAEANKLKITGDALQGESPAPGSTVTVKWLALRDPKSGRWSVHHDPTGLAAATRALGKPEDLKAFDDYRAVLDAAARSAPANYPAYRPLLVLTNPHRPYSKPEDSHKNAVTGDFDLFAVWPREGRDADFRVRVGGMLRPESAAQMSAQKKAIYAAEERNAIGKVVGNISDGLYYIGGMLNAVMAAKTNQTVNRIFHSDEGGRPGMNEVDASVAFHPDGRVLFFADTAAGNAQFARFALECATAKPVKFVVFLNAGWIAPLKAAAPAEAAALEKAVAWQSSLADTAPPPAQKAK